jgi:hypothetical protein
MSSAVAAAALAAKVFLGEAYPSGHVYLAPFTAAGKDTPTQENKLAISTWPATVTLYGVDPVETKNDDVGTVTRQAKRDRYFVPERPSARTKKDDNPSFHYIPGLEGLDETHTETCKLPYKKNKAYRYVENNADFFGTIGDFCFTDEVIAVYHTERPTKHVAYRVLAVPSDWTLTDVQLFHAGDDKYKAPPRPLSAAERKAIQKRKAQIPKDYECTTEPGGIDQAQIMARAKIKGHKESIRISYYSDPGCAGHLSDIYVLDIVNGDQVEGTFDLGHYQGPI